MSLRDRVFKQFMREIKTTFLRVHIKQFGCNIFSNASNK